MAQIKNDNILARAPKPIDERSGLGLVNGIWKTFTSVAQALADPDVIRYRYESMTLPINDGVNPMVEYWFSGGIDNSNFVVKTTDLTGYVPYTGATGDVTLGSHNITAGSFIKTGGTASQFLKADGSVDSTNYASVSALNAGLQLKANVSGQVFTGNISAPNLSGTNTGDQDLSGYQLLTQKNQANGYAGLDSGAKIFTSQLPDSILGALIYQGTWNAATNTPTLANPPASSTKGNFYVTDTPGTQFGLTFAMGDWIVSNGTEWQKVDNTDAVVSVFGRIGNVLANESDYSAYYPVLTGSYVDPSWITSLPYSKITGVPDLSTYVTLNTQQTITRPKIFEQGIYFESEFSTDYAYLDHAGGLKFNYGAIYRTDYTNYQISFIKSGISQAIQPNWTGLTTNSIILMPVNKSGTIALTTDIPDTTNFALKNGTNATGTWPIGITGNAATASDATKWSGQFYDAATSDNNLTALLGYNVNTNLWTKTSLGDLKSRLGIPSGGETLQSVTDRGGTTTSELLFPSWKMPFRAANLNSRTWLLSNDVLSYGDLGIGQSTTQSLEGFDYKIYINPSGSVGIGTSSPLTKFQVKTSTDSNFGIIDDSSGGIIISSLTDNASLNRKIRYDATYHNFNVGNVGIGYAADQGATLAVNGTFITSSVENSGWGAIVQNTGTTGANGLYVNIGSGSTGIPFRVDRNGVSTFSVNNDGSSTFTGSVTAPTFNGNATSANTWNEYESGESAGSAYIMTTMGGVDKWHYRSLANFKNDLGLSSSGSYTPTVILSTNAAVATASKGHYTRVGSMVTVYGNVNITAGPSAGGTSVELTLPIASNLTDSDDLNGVVQTSFNGNQGSVFPNLTDNRIVLLYNTTSASFTTNCYYSYMYKVI